MLPASASVARQTKVQELRALFRRKGFVTIGSIYAEPAKAEPLSDEDIISDQIIQDQEGWITVYTQL